MPTKDWKLDAIREFRTALNAVAAGAGVAPRSQGQGTWTGQEHGAQLRFLHSHCFSFISI